MALPMDNVTFYRLLNMEKDRERARRRLLMFPPGGGFKRRLWKAQSGRCYYCCASLLPRYHLDHMHPKSKGGANAPENYRFACQPCNVKKRTRSVMDFVLSLLL